MTWRGWLAWAGTGSAIVLGAGGDWLASGIAAWCAAMLAAWWVGSEFAATRERMRISDEAFAKIAQCQTANRQAVGTPALPSGAPELFP